MKYKTVTWECPFCEAAHTITQDSLPKTVHCSKCQRTSEVVGEISHKLVLRVPTGGVVAKINVSAPSQRGVAVTTHYTDGTSDTAYAPDLTQAKRRAQLILRADRLEVPKSLLKLIATGTLSLTDAAEILSRR